MDFNEDLKKTPSKKMTSSPRPFTRIFGTALAKIGWAFYSQPPAHAATLKRWERFAATVVHGLLYTMMVLIPVTGYLVSTSEGEGVDLWGLFTVPAVFVAGEALRDLAIEAHYWCGYAVGGLALVHAGGALKHQFLDRDGTLRRMLW